MSVLEVSWAVLEASWAVLDRDQKKHRKNDGKMWRSGVPNKRRAMRAHGSWDPLNDNFQRPQPTGQQNHSTRPARRSAVADICIHMTKWNFEIRKQHSHKVASELPLGRYHALALIKNFNPPPRFCAQGVTKGSCGLWCWFL